MAKLGESVAQLIQVSKSAQPEQLFFESAEEPLNAPVTLGLPNEGRRRFHPQEGDLGLEIVAHVDTAVIVTEPHADRYAGGERAELLLNRLADRLERLETVRPFDRVNANAVGATSGR